MISVTVDKQNSDENEIISAAQVKISELYNKLDEESKTRFDTWKDGFDIQLSSPRGNVKEVGGTITGDDGNTRSSDPEPDPRATSTDPAAESSEEEGEIRSAPGSPKSYSDVEDAEKNVYQNHVSARHESTKSNESIPPLVTSTSLDDTYRDENDFVTQFETLVKAMYDEKCLTEDVDSDVALYEVMENALDSFQQPVSKGARDLGTLYALLESLKHQEKNFARSAKDKLEKLVDERFNRVDLTFDISWLRKSEGEIESLYDKFKRDETQLIAEIGNDLVGFYRQLKKGKRSHVNTVLDVITYLNRYKEVVGNIIDLKETSPDKLKFVQLHEKIRDGIPFQDCCSPGFRDRVEKVRREIQRLLEKMRLQRLQKEERVIEVAVQYSRKRYCEMVLRLSQDEYSIEALKRVHTEVINEIFAAFVRVKDFEYTFPWYERESALDSLCEHEFSEIKHRKLQSRWNRIRRPAASLKPNNEVIPPAISSCSPVSDCKSRGESIAVKACLNATAAASSSATPVQRSPTNASEKVEEKTVPEEPETVSAIHGGDKTVEEPVKIVEVKQEENKTTAVSRSTMIVSPTEVQSPGRVPPNHEKKKPIPVIIRSSVQESYNERKPTPQPTSPGKHRSPRSRNSKSRSPRIREKTPERTSRSSTRGSPASSEQNRSVSSGHTRTSPGKRKPPPPPSISRTSSPADEVGIFITETRVYFKIYLSERNRIVSDETTPFVRYPCEFTTETPAFCDDVLPLVGNDLNVFDYLMDPHLSRVKVPPGGSKISWAEQVLALFFIRLQRKIQRIHNVDIRHARVAVGLPSSVISGCKQRLKTALKMAGIHESVFIQVTTAIAISFRKFYQDKKAEYALVVYVNRRTVDVAVVQLDRNANVNVVSTSSCLNPMQDLTSSQEQFEGDVYDAIARAINRINLNWHLISYCTAVVDYVSIKGVELGYNPKFASSFHRSLNDFTRKTSDVKVSDKPGHVLDGLLVVSGERRAQSSSSVYKELFPYDICLVNVHCPNHPTGEVMLAMCNSVAEEKSVVLSASALKGVKGYCKIMVFVPSEKCLQLEDMVMPENSVNSNQDKPPALVEFRVSPEGIVSLDCASNEFDGAGPCVRLSGPHHMPLVFYSGALEVVQGVADCSFDDEPVFKRKK